MTSPARSVVLLGAPGAGKGTQAARLAAWRRLRHVSTGDLLRRAIADESPLGARVKPILAAGGLVDDETVAALVADCLDEHGRDGLLLDGYPRTIGQAERLRALLEERGLPEPLVVEIRVEEEEVVRRLAGRRTCASCGPRPSGEEPCGRCGGALQARPDDDEAVVRQRLRIHAAQTAPLARHYDQRGLLRAVDGSGDPEEVSRRIREVVERDV